MPDSEHAMHEWFRTRLAPQFFGLLDEDEASRFLAHARECAECDARMKAFATEWRGNLRDGQHIPARLLARWDRAQSRLRGMTRRMVRAHLESCEACRQDLVMTGHSPRLDVVPELESEEETAAQSRPDTPRPPGRISSPPGPDAATRRRWFFGGSLAGALATAATFLIVSRIANFTLNAPAAPDEHVAPAPPSAAPSTTPAPSTVRELPSLAIQPARLKLRAPRRSSDSPPPVATLPPGIGHLDLELPDLFVSNDTALRLGLVNSAGVKLDGLRCLAGDLTGGRSVRVGSEARPLVAGRYRLTVASADSATAPFSEFEFEVRSADR